MHSDDKILIAAMDALEACGEREHARRHYRVAEHLSGLVLRVHEVMLRMRDYRLTHGTQTGHASIILADLAAGGASLTARQRQACAIASAMLRSGAEPSHAERMEAQRMSRGVGQEERGREA